MRIFLIILSIALLVPSVGLAKGFLAGVKIESSVGTFQVVEKLKLKDCLTAQDEGGNLVTSQVRGVSKNLLKSYLVLTSAVGTVATSHEQLFLTETRGFIRADALMLGEKVVVAVSEKGLESLDPLKPVELTKTEGGYYGYVPLENVQFVKSYKAAYSVSTNYPNTYLANHYVVHNESNGEICWACVDHILVFVVLFVVLSLIALLFLFSRVSRTPA